MSLNIRPIAGTKNRVVVLPDEPAEKTAGGIFIPDTAKQRPQRGKVMAVTPNAGDRKPTVCVGDTVMYGKFSGTEVEDEGIVYLLMLERDILAVVG